MRHLFPRAVSAPSSSIRPSFRIGLTVLSRALSGLAIPIRAATVEGVNFVEGAAAARERSARHALVVTFG